MSKVLQYLLSATISSYNTKIPKNISPIAVSSVLSTTFPAPEAALSDADGVGLGADEIEGADGNDPVRLPLQSATPRDTNSLPALMK